MTWTVVIPSRSDEKVLDCVASIVDTHPSIRVDQIVIVSDGLSASTRRELRGVIWVEGVEPFVFSRAINMGVRAMRPDSDIVIHGDDVRWVTQGGIELLSCSAAPNGWAAVAPEVVGLCGQRAQRAGEIAGQAPWLAFICAYLKRDAWNSVGELDERFVGYGYDDVDWCRRASQRQYTLRIDHSIRVLHIDDSSYRSDPSWTQRYAENRVLYEEKWGKA